MKKIFIISVIILLLDIVSKRLVVNFIDLNSSINIINNFFSLTYVKNTGVAFSLLEGYVWLVVIATVVILYMIVKYIKNNVNNKYELIGYGFIIGGAVGNLCDRIIFGYVIDFLDFNILGYDFPIFNLADTFIVIGVILLMIFGRNGEEDEVSSRKES